MSRLPIFVSRRIPDVALEYLREHTDMRLWREDLPPTYAALRHEIAGVAGILCMLTERMDAGILDAAPDLKVISNMAVGYDNIDVAAATARGIPVGNTPDVLTETTADMAFALLMAAARRLPEGERYIKNGLWQTWSPTLLLGQDVYGATLGIIGLGRIGTAVARRARGFGMQVLYHGGSNIDYVREVGAEQRHLDTLLSESDFISIHAPLTDATHHLISERELALMKPSAVLINTARGGLVNPAALYAALRDNTIFAAALDVTEPEPIDHDDPLLTLDNCLIVPHIGSSSVATREKMARMAADNLLAGLRGDRLPNCVNPAIYDNKG